MSCCHSLAGTISHSGLADVNFFTGVIDDTPVDTPIDNPVDTPQTPPEELVYHDMYKGRRDYWFGDGFLRIKNKPKAGGWDFIGFRTEGYHKYGIGRGSLKGSLYFPSKTNEPMLGITIGQRSVYVSETYDGTIRYGREDFFMEGSSYSFFEPSWDYWATLVYKDYIESQGYSTDDIFLVLDSSDDASAVNSINLGSKEDGDYYFYYESLGGFWSPHPFYYPKPRPPKESEPSLYTIYHFKTKATERTLQFAGIYQAASSDRENDKELRDFLSTLI